MSALPQTESLTGIRYFAAAAVLMYHFVPANHPLAWLFRDGWLGVPFFFVLSGAVLSYSYLPQLLERGTIRAPRFLALRFARIYPCYLLAFLIGLGPFVASQCRATGSFEVAAVRIVGGAALYLSMIQAWLTTPWTSGVVVSPAWSLSCEWFYYVAFCPLLLTLRPALAAGPAASWRGLLVACSLIAACAGAEYALSSFYPTPIRNFWSDYFWRGPFGNFPYFLGGIFVGRLLRQPPATPMPPVALTAFAGIVAIIAIVCYPAEGIATSLKRVAILPATAVAIYGLGCGPSNLSRCLGLPVFSLLGEASYPLYLLQFPLEDWLSFVLPAHSLVGALMRLIVYSAISVLVAVCLERPARDFIRKRLVAADGSTVGR
jgi:peptidoglycan/LPS O-acetylase OafA/YrhL